MIAPPVVYDGTRPAEEHTNGPGRLAHAYPEGSHIALCGHTRTDNAPQGDGPRCQACLTEAGRKNWVNRG